MTHGTPNRVPAHDDHTEATFSGEHPQGVGAAGMDTSSPTPVAGNGKTAGGCAAATDISPEYMEIARARIALAAAQPRQTELFSA